MVHPKPLIAQSLAVVGALAWGLAPDPFVPWPALRAREVLRRDRLNEADYERMERGYYEHLLDAGRQLGAPAGAGPAAGATPFAPVFEDGPLTQPVDDLREYVLKPNVSVVQGGVHWSTNALGMRDAPCAMPEPPGTARIALVGDSIAAGWGVDDGLGFEPRLERALDARARSAGGPAVEVLNFAVPGYAPGQRWANFTRVGWATGPDLLIYEATPADPGWDVRRLRGLLPRGLGWDARQYRDALARLGVRPGRDADAYYPALRRARWEVLAGVYRAVADDCRARGVPAIWVLIPRVGKPADAAERDRLIALARGSGFAAAIDLSDTFDGLEPADVAISPADYHPNAEGHARLARRLEAALIARPEVRRLLAGPGPGAGADRR